MFRQNGYLLVFLLAISSSVAYGVDLNISDSEICGGDSKHLCQKKSRLTAFKPNTLAWETTTDDESSLEANYSFRYLLTRPDCSVEKGDEKITCNNEWNNRNEWFFTYTGKFDFYMGTRNSGPVVNRISNPALHWRLYNPSFIHGIDWLNIALEHRSNGQVTEYDLKDSNGDYIAETKWNDGDRKYIDGISRGANYFSAEIKKKLIIENTKFDFYISAKAYFTEDSKVTWGARKGSGDKISDYDILRFVVEGNTKSSKTWLSELEYSVEYTVGTKAFETDSINASLYFPYVYGKRTYFPINYIKIHVGPMNELSNYTEPQTSIYIGFKLNPWPML